MTEVQKIKQALDPELYVKAVARWQREKEAARAAGNVIGFPVCQAWPETPEPPKSETPDDKPERIDPNLVFSVLLAAFGMFCVAVALIV